MSKICIVLYSKVDGRFDARVYDTYDGAIELLLVDLNENIVSLVLKVYPEFIDSDTCMNYGFDCKFLGSIIEKFEKEVLSI